MNKKVLNFAIAMAMLGGSAMFTACDDDDDNDVKATVSVTCDVAGSISADEIDGAVLTAIATESKDTYTFTVSKNDFDANGNGKITIKLPVGVYDFSLEKSAEGKTIFLRSENVTVKGDDEISVKLIATAANSADYQFIFSEIFFNGERNAGRMMHPDQYMVLYNPTNNVLYADGLAVGCTMQASCTEKESWYDEYYNAGKVPVHGVIVIPGSGYDVPVKPHDKLVIAFTAINHTATENRYVDKVDTIGSGDNVRYDTTWVDYTYENAINLTGADFEIYDPQLYTSDVDNPEVPNVLEIYPAESDYGGIGGFYQHPRGFYCPFIFKLENGTQAALDAFFKANTSTATVADKEGNNVEIQMLSVAADKILDGITTGHIPSDIVTNPLPQTVDRGKQLVKGCHSGILVKRKGSDKDGYADTNNSTEDCEQLVPHKDYADYSAGWRNR